MLSSDKLKKLIVHWEKSTQDNYEVMQILYQKKHYDACLFFGHLALEKTLKIFVMEETKDLAPKIHNLVRLAELAKQEFTETEWCLLADANEFNMASSYPEAKYDFYKKCDKKYTDRYYENIKNLYTKLWQKKR